ncbi:MAG: aminotransferase class V-fold PLP-dependent enzyme [Bacteroidales bacterium]
MSKTDPATRLQFTQHSGEHDGVNPAITDSSTFRFDSASLMTDCFEGKLEGAFLYGRHWNPTNLALSEALAAIENSEAAWVTGSGMAAITNTILQICSSGDHLITSVTTYGGTYAFFRNVLPRFNIEVTFVDIADLASVRSAIRPNTRLIYTESLTNPLLVVSDLPALAEIAHSHGLKLVVDNTFTPMVVSPIDHGADVVVHSLTKFINGKSDGIGGAICASRDFINSLSNVNDGIAMLLGPVLDPMRSSSVHKNLFTLHIRMKQHSRNAQFIAEKLAATGLQVTYPGLPTDTNHGLMKRLMNPDYGFGGILSLDAGTKERANDLMVAMQKRGVGFIAVSLGYFKTLFSNSGTSTSSEVPTDVQRSMGLSPGLVRMAIGLDNDIEHTWELIRSALTEVKLI